MEGAPMTGFATIGGIMIGIFGLLIAVYGLDSQVPFASQAFSAGVALAAAGGIIVWQGQRKKPSTFTTPTYKGETQSSYSQSDKSKFQNMYDTLPVMLRLVNTEGVILECNQRYAKNFGDSKNDVIGRSVFDHVAEKSKDEMKKTFETWKKSGIVNNAEIWFKRKDGTIFPCLLSASNILDEKGKLLGSNTAIRDISEIYEARKILDEHDEIKKAELLKSDFYMTLVKEYKIPLEPIKKYSNILKQVSTGKLNDKQTEAVKEISENAAKLEQLIHDIITVQKLESKTLEITKEKFNVGIFMENVLNSLMPMMEDKKIEFINSSDVKKLLNSDKEKIKEVFTNLIQNAVDFVPTDGGKIEIAAKEIDDTMQFYVRDNGSGILEKKKDMIFKKFYQVDISFKRKFGGSGFGLVICKGIIEI